MKSNIEKVFDTEEITVKNRKIDEVIIKLKNEFIGIDEQIDQVMSHIRSWYLYPMLQTSPVVVCLWGLTGIGKTSLLRKIVEYLNVEEDLVYFNFAEINEMTSYDVENNIEEQLSNEKSNRIFVYDEFQYAATLDAHGEEKDNKNGLKPFWELLDTGIIHKKFDIWNIRSITKVLYYLSWINSRCYMNIVNGEWVNANECLSYFDEWERGQLSDMFRFNDSNTSGNTDDCEVYDSSGRNKFFIRADTLERIILFTEKFDHKIVDTFSMREKLMKMPIDELMSYLNNLVKKVNKGYNLSFNNSIIFIVGNLDEAYDIAYNVSPDMSPDQFNQITKKISVVDIKKALQKRFRNEQIARMGNTHIAYPSFSTDSFQKIIALNLADYAKQVKELSGFDIEYDKSINDIIYKESVFPTHGTRPIFSTVQDIVKTKLPVVMESLISANIEVSRISKLTYYYKKKNIIIAVFDENGNEMHSLSAPVSLRLASLRKNLKNEEQANTALHESGHFVMYAKLFDRLPEKLVSVTADSDVQGFMLQDDDNTDVHSRNWIMNQICVALGGYVAEKMFFGKDNMSNGASNDINRATALASEMVREYGLGEDCIRTSHVRNSNEHSKFLVEDKQEYITSQIKAIVKECEKRVEDTFNNVEWRNMLRESAQWLANHPMMGKKKMKEIYNKVGSHVKNTSTVDYYRNIVKNM